MEIVWQRIDDIDKYVVETLSREAPDIPQALIDLAPWCVEITTLDMIKVDHMMIDRHNIQSIHIKRSDAFILSCKNKVLPLPLIVLGRDMFLVDGYARYRALRKLDVANVKVIKQNFD